MDVADCPLEILTPPFKRSRPLGGALALEDRPRDSPSPGPGPETPEKITHPEEEVQEEQQQEVEEAEKPLQHGLTLEESRQRSLWSTASWISIEIVLSFSIHEYLCLKIASLLIQHQKKLTPSFHSHIF